MLKVTPSLQLSYDIVILLRNLYNLNKWKTFQKKFHVLNSMLVTN